MNSDAMKLSQRGDEVFAALAGRFPRAKKWRLLFEERLDARRFAAIRSAMLAYVSRVLGSPEVLEEPPALRALLERRGDLPSYTQGGMLAPTREQTLEFNLLHRSLASALGDYDLEDRIDGIDLPINVRLVYGDVDEARARAPFSSTKLHSDVWAGVPPDAAVVVLPVLGDIDTLTIECFEMAREQELAAMRALGDYDEGRAVAQAARVAGRQRSVRRERQHFFQIVELRADRALVASLFGVASQRHDLAHETARVTGGVRLEM